ncbi:MAG: type II secretion system protein GspM [Giesbergeria sp.]
MNRSIPPSRTSASALQARWQALAPREQSLLLTASTVVALALLWWLALAPALQTLRSAPARHASLDGQLQHMQALQAEALQLQAQPRANADEAQRALQASVTSTLGSNARLTLNGDHATLTLKGSPADALASWLAQARGNARAAPQDMRLVRSPAPESRTGAPASAAAPGVRWDGSIVLALPPR